MTVIRTGGNDEVVQLLEHFAKEARDNPNIAYGTVVLTEAGQLQSHGGWAGDVALEARAERAARQSANDIRERIINRTMPPRDPDVPADYVVYNVPSGSISYDFLIWLLDAEMARLREGASPPLKVYFWFGRDGKAGLSLPQQRVMFDNVVKPSLDLIGAIEHPDAVHGRDYPPRHFRDIVQAANNGEKIPVFKAPPRAREAMRQWLARDGDQREPIVITLREAEHWPHRNSDLDAWREFARDRQEAGDRVIFVRDTAKVNEPSPWNTCPAASANLHMRMALYELAKANLFVANGPCTLAQFSDRPWLCFTPIEPDDSPYKANTAMFWRMYVGIDVGEQFPWSRPNQRIVWQKDTYENICAAWQAHGTLLDKSVAA